VSSKINRPLSHNAYVIILSLIYSSRYSLSTAVVSRAPSQSFHSALLSTLYPLSLSLLPCTAPALANTFPSQSLAYLIKSHEHQIQKGRSDAARPVSLRLAFISASTPSLRCCGCQPSAGSLLRRGVSFYQDYPHRTTATCTRKTN
jgi:hypothetical protein